MRVPTPARADTEAAARKRGYERAIAVTWRAMPTSANVPAALTQVHAGLPLWAWIVIAAAVVIALAAATARRRRRRQSVIKTRLG
jgi:lysylphosphatidylglycerol synthetase-like protein (DUF2156 family)